MSWMTLSFGGYPQSAFRPLRSLTRLDGKRPGALGKRTSPWHGTSQWSVRLPSLTSTPQVIQLLAPQNLPSIGRRPSSLVSPEFSFCTNRGWNSWDNSSLLSGFSRWDGSAVECRYRRCARDDVVSAHLCGYSTVQCDTHTWVCCCTRGRAGPLAIPTCVLACDFSPLAFYTIGYLFKFILIKKIIIFARNCGNCNALQLGAARRRIINIPL